MNAIRTSRPAVRLRHAHSAGEPVLLALEGLCLIPAGVVLTWAAVAPGHLTQAVASAVCLAAAAAMIGAAWLATPDGSPRRPSWFQAQSPRRSGSRQRASRG